MPKKTRFSFPKYLYGILAAAALIVALVVAGARLANSRTGKKSYSAAELGTLNLGINSLKSGSPDQAIEYFNRVIQSNPNLGEAYNNRGLAYQAKGSLDLALADFQKAVKLLPKEATPYNNRGSIYFSQGDFEKALADFNQAIKTDPQFAKAYYNRGAVYLQTENYEGAVVDFSQAIAYTPEITATLATATPAVVSSLDIAISIAQRYANLPLAYANRGSAYLSLGDLERALKDCSKAIALQPDLALAYYYQGLVYYANLDYVHAIAGFTKVLELNNDPEVIALAKQRLVEIGGK